MAEKVEIPESELSALSILSISEEDEEKFPEAVAMLKKIAASLGPNGESKHVLEKKLQLEMEHKQLQTSVGEKKIFIAAIKDIILEQQIGNYNKIPKHTVENISKKIHMAEMKANYGDDLQNVLGLGQFVSNMSLELTSSEKSILIEAIQEKLQVLPPDSSNLKKEVDGLKRQLVATLVNVQKKNAEKEKLEAENDELMKRMSAAHESKLNADLVKADIVSVQHDLSILQSKLDNIRVMKELYGDERSDALKILLAKSEEEFKASTASVQTLHDKLRLYCELPKSQFQPILEEYRKLKKEIENAKWSLEKLKND